MKKRKGWRGREGKGREGKGRDIARSRYLCAAYDWVDSLFVADK